MKPHCEVVVYHVLPTIRAMVAKELIEKYGFTQKDAAMKMGLTQPAISQYYKNARGHNTKILESNKEISRMIDAISEGLAKNTIDIGKAAMMFCEICDEVQKSDILPRIS